MQNFGEFWWDKKRWWWLRTQEEKSGTWGKKEEENLAFYDKSNLILIELISMYLESLKYNIHIVGYLKSKSA